MGVAVGGAASEGVGIGLAAGVALGVSVGTGVGSDVGLAGRIGVGTCLSLGTDVAIGVGEGVGRVVGVTVGTGLAIGTGVGIDPDVCGKSSSVPHPVATNITANTTPREKANLATWDDCSRLNMTSSIKNTNLELQGGEILKGFISIACRGTEFLVDVVYNTHIRMQLGTKSRDDKPRQALLTIYNHRKEILLWQTLLFATVELLMGRGTPGITATWPSRAG